MTFKSKSLPTMNTINGISKNSIVAQKPTILTLNRNVPIQSSKHTSNIRFKRPLISQHRLPIKRNDDSTKIKYRMNNTSTIQPTNDKNKESHIVSNTENLTENKTELRLGKLNSQTNDRITSELGTINRKLNTNENDKTMIKNQEIFDLLDKLKQSANAVPIGPMPLSLQACRFELPFDLKLLETLTPLDYLSKYCRLSSRRQYQFKRIFDKYRNRYYHFESSYLYLSLLDIHQQNLTHSQFDYLCQLIDLGNQQYQFIFDTYAGILALCERVLYKSSPLYKDQDDYYLTKDAIEKCDFYSLNRKFDGLIISDTMKRLLHAL